MRAHTAHTHACYAVTATAHQAASCTANTCSRAAIFFGRSLAVLGFEVTLGYASGQKRWSCIDQWVDRRMDQPLSGLLRWHPLVRPYLEVLAHW